MHEAIPPVGMKNETPQTSGAAVHAFLCHCAVTDRRESTLVSRSGGDARSHLAEPQPLPPCAHRSTAAHAARSHRSVNRPIDDKAERRLGEERPRPRRHGETDSSPQALRGHTQWEELTSGCLKKTLPRDILDGESSVKNANSACQICVSTPVQTEIEPGSIVCWPAGADAVDAGFCHAPHSFQRDPARCLEHHFR